MQDDNRIPTLPTRFRTASRRWRIVLSVCLLVGLVLAVLLYSERHQIHQFLQGLRVPAAQAVQITPLALTPGSATASPTPVTSADWPTYHRDGARTGYDASTADPTALSRLWAQPLDGAVYGEPLVIGGRVLVATEGDTVYALDAATGRPAWHTNLGRPVPLDDLPCGNIDPLGITGTPAYDPLTGLVFVVAEVQGPAHLLDGLDVATGQVKVRRLVDPAGSDPRVYQQRAALAVAAGEVYIAFGGLLGDCGPYRGTVVAARTDGRGQLVIYQVPTEREGGIWAPPGPVLDAQGNLYVSVGNGAATGGGWDHSDSVLKLSANLQLEDAFAPRSWPQDNASDLDLGSLGPIFLPDGLLFIQGKSNQGYLLRANHLGGVGGQLQSVPVCAGGAYGGAAVVGAEAFLPCADGLREIRLGSDGNVLAGWQAPSQVTGSPVIGGTTVYSLAPSGGMLYALDAATGSVRATVAVGGTSRFATPTLYHQTVLVGTLSGVVAVTIAS
jgi:outer membrane protein assembly factor BamB